MNKLDYSEKNAALVGFLYILMRDHLPSGTVESIMEKHVEKARGMSVSQFTNEHLARHAIDVAERLKAQEPK